MKTCLVAVGALAAVTVGAMQVESGESAPEKRAAAELKKYVALLAEEEPDAKFRIGVKYLDEFPADKAAIGGWDGYAVRRKDGFVYIVSPQPRGCLFGVYDFLERNSDIIWARPDEECGTIYTRTKTFDIRAADFVEVPKFQMRGWWFCGPQKHEASEYWHARVRCNFGCCNQRFPEVVRRAKECGFMIGGAAGHNLPQFIPDEMYETHPEYFAEVSGVRRRDKGHTQFCFSNMDGARVVGETAVKKIAEKLAGMKAAYGVAFDHWALKQADNQRLCECAACQADIPLGDGRVSKKGDANFRSNQMFRYLNKAVEIVEKAYPDMRVDTFAYQFSAPPPDVKVHEKFNVAFCPFIKNDRFAVTNAVNAKWAERAEKWSKATKNVMWREYWGCASGYPRQNSFVAAEDLKWINSKLGFTRVYSETIPDLDNRGPKQKGADYRGRWDASAMEHWVISRLMWNPYVPVEKYREEYITRTYRKAAAPMREFYGLIAKTWFSDDLPTNYCDDPSGSAARYIVGAGIADRLLALLDEAAKLAKDDMPAVVKLIARQKAYFADLIANAGSPEEPKVVPLVTDGDWSKAAVIDGFSKVSRGRKAARVPADRKTKVFICHDMKNLKVKFVCDDDDPANLVARECAEGAPETFPSGDHIEFGVTTQKGRYHHHFAVNCRNARADIRNGDIGYDAKWTSAARMTKTGYEIELSIDFESIGAEITKENRFGACCARMSPPRDSGRGKEFSSWNGVHPQSAMVYSPIFISMESAEKDETTAPEKFATEELRHWLGEISESPVEETFKVGVKYLDLFPDDKAALAGTDGFAVRRRDGAIYVTSPMPRGVIYGVYALLERNSDLIFPRADSEAVFTRVKKLQIRDADFRERPAFDELRGWWICGPQYHADTELWYARQRCSFTPARIGKPGVYERAVQFGTIINRGGGHNMPGFYTDEMFAAHPEYFGEEKGARQRDIRRVHPCFSNLEGAHAAGRVVVEKMRQLPEQPPPRYAIKHADHQTLCSCALCKANPDSVSTRFFKYLNEMMKEVRAAYPDTIVTTFGYQITAEPPAVKVDDHVLISFCPYVKDDKRSILDPENAKWKERADRWVKECGAHLNWREYFGDGMAFPRPIAPVVARDLRYINSELGVRSVFAETTPDLGPSKPDGKTRACSQSWDVSAMEYWILSRIMWNPFQDVDKLRAEYLRRSYRRAAPAIARFYKPIIDAFYASPAKSRFDANQYQESMRYLFKTGLESQCRDALDEAARLAAGEPPAVARLVSRLRARFDDWCAHKGDFERQELAVPQTDDWAKAGATDMFYLRGSVGRTPPEHSRVLVRHDTKTLFVRFRCDDSNPSRLRAPKFDPSSEIGLEGDGVKVMFGLDGNTNGPTVSVSCDVNGNRCDVKSVKPWRKYSAEWKATVSRDKRGYTVDFELPLKSFGLDAERNKNLDVCFYRLIQHEERPGRRKVSTWGGSDPRKRQTWGILKFE